MMMMVVMLWDNKNNNNDNNVTFCSQHLHSPPHLSQLPLLLLLLPGRMVMVRRRRMFFFLVMIMMVMVMMWNGNSGNNGKWRCCRFGDVTCKTDFRYRHHHHHKPGELLQQLFHHFHLHPILATWILAEDVPCLLEAVQAYSPNIPSLVMITIIIMIIKLNAVMMEN